MQVWEGRGFYIKQVCAAKKVSSHLPLFACDSGVCLGSMRKQVGQGQCRRSEGEGGPDHALDSAEASAVSTTMKTTG